MEKYKAGIKEQLIRQGMVRGQPRPPNNPPSAAGGPSRSTHSQSARSPAQQAQPFSSSNFSGSLPPSSARYGPYPSPQTAHSADLERGLISPALLTDSSAGVSISGDEFFTMPPHHVPSQSQYLSSFPAGMGGHRNSLSGKYALPFVYCASRSKATCPNLFFFHILFATSPPFLTLNE